MKIKKGPWIIKKSAIVYKNPWMEVREDQVIQPDGKDGIYGVANIKAGVSILAMDNHGDVFLTKEYHYAVEQITTEVVSGGIDDNESPFEAAQRELAEETGLTAIEWIELGRVDPYTSTVLGPNYLFLARQLTEGKSSQEATESIKVIKVSFKQALKWVRDGTLTHGASMAVILKTAFYLRSAEILSF